MELENKHISDFNLEDLSETIHIVRKYDIDGTVEVLKRIEEETYFVRDNLYLDLRFKIKDIVWEKFVTLRDSMLIRSKIYSWNIQTIDMSTATHRLRKFTGYVVLRFEFSENVFEVDKIYLVPVKSFDNFHVTSHYFWSYPENTSNFVIKDLFEKINNYSSGSLTKGVR